MEKKIDLVEILKDCPMGTKLYSCLHGEVEFCNIADSGFPILVSTKLNYYPSFTSDGRYLGDGYEGECVLFPSKDNRDWSTFVAPKKKVERFDPKTLKPFDQVLVRDNTLAWLWTPRILSYIDSDGIFVDTSGTEWEVAIPYKGNERLALCSDDPEDEHYRYWED